MSNSNFSDLSELALAGYGQFLSKGTPPTARLTDLNGDPYGFSERQADRFASRFNVTVPTFNDATSMGGSGATSSSFHQYSY